MKQINKGKVLLIPDFHQSLGFIEAILHKEKDYDYIVMMGDVIDTYHDIDNQIYFSVKEVCKWINKTLDNDKFIWLIGNHDLTYMASYTTKNYPSNTNNYYCSGWTRSKAKYFNKYIDSKWFNKLELCCKVGEYIISHAGFHFHHFLPHITEFDNIQKLYDKWETEKIDFRNKSHHWMYNVGYCRGGYDKVGSPIWLDWNQEFTPLDEIQQIVGHTHIKHYDTRLKRNSIGLNNYCIDCNQKMYSVWNNGKLSFNEIKSNDYLNFIIP